MDILEAMFQTNTVYVNISHLFTRSEVGLQTEQTVCGPDKVPKATLADT